MEFKAKDIKEIENLRKVGIEEVITNPTVSNLELLLMKGLNKTRSEIEDEIDALIKEKGKEDLMLEIVEALVDGGFLGKSVLEAMKKYLAKTEEMIKNI